MRALAWALAAVTLVGVVCRLLPGPLSALPFVPVVVAATPWYALTALASLALFVWNLVAAGRAGLSVAGMLPPALMVLVVLLEAFWQGPFFALSPTNAVKSATNQPAAFELRVMTCNVYKGRADAARIVELVRTEGVQVLALQETTADFVNELEAAGIDELLPHSQRSSSDGVYGNGLWSSLPLGDVASDDIGSSASAMPGGTVTLEGDAGDEAAARAARLGAHVRARAGPLEPLAQEHRGDWGGAREARHRSRYPLRASGRLQCDLRPRPVPRDAGGWCRWPSARGRSTHGRGRARVHLALRPLDGTPALRHRPRRCERWRCRPQRVDGPRRRHGPQGAPLYAGNRRQRGRLEHVWSRPQAHLATRAPPHDISGTNCMDSSL